MPVLLSGVCGVCSDCEVDVSLEEINLAERPSSVVDDSEAAAALLWRCRSFYGVPPGTGTVPFDFALGCGGRARGLEPPMWSVRTAANATLCFDRHFLSVICCGILQSNISTDMATIVATGLGIAAAAFLVRSQSVIPRDQCLTKTRDEQVLWPSAGHAPEPMLLGGHFTKAASNQK